MSGHNKWSTIKHRKGAQDAKRGKIFTKIIKEITVAARMGGGDSDANPRLRAAIAWARSANMPNDNIKKAIDKGTGNQQGVDYTEVIYEGYGPHNIATVVECLTDNKNRTVASVRAIFSKSGGSLGSSNSVLYMFDNVGSIRVLKSEIEEEELTEYILETNAQDIEAEEEHYCITTAAADLSDTVSFLEAKGVAIDSSAVEMKAQNELEITEASKAKQVIAFIDKLEDDDDVQKVHTNLSISAEVLGELSA